MFCLVLVRLIARAKGEKIKQSGKIIKEKRA
jgi:hypothetical protein